MEPLIHSPVLSSADQLGGGGRGRIVCVGETMAQLSPTPPQPLFGATQLALNFAGAESTVALYLSHLGHQVSWVSRLGTDPFGRRIDAELNDAGVDTSFVQHDPWRPTGVYFKDPGPAGTSVFYYRAGAAATEMTADWLPKELLAEAQLVHVTGITPALSESCRETTERLFELGHRYGYTISFDVNYRPALWPNKETAAETLLSFANRADIVFVGLDEAQSLWQTETPAAVRVLLNTPGELIVKDGAVGATLFADANLVFEPAHQVEVVEPVGAGDSFAAGYLHERLMASSGPKRLRSAHHLAAAVLSTTADFVVPLELQHVAKH